MHINRHQQHATAELAIATAGAPRQPDLTERTVIATAGTWHPGRWHVDVSAAAATRTMTALTARTEPDERALTTRERAATARLLAGWCRWDSGKTWAAIRTAPRAMTLLADDAQR